MTEEGNVSARSPTTFCPYAGLAPFSITHANYFFGRDLDAAIIIDNLLAVPLCVLFGGSGVGKTSVINVGLSRACRALGVDSIPIVCRRWQGTAFRGRLTRAIAAAGGLDESVWEGANLRELVRTATLRTGQPLMLVLDQFEEYFLYHDGEDGEPFVAELAELVADDGVDAHVLLSLRDDRLHLLDRLKLTLPGVLETTLELRHLDDKAVERAIVGPIEVYNREYPHAARRIEVEPEFVRRLIKDLHQAAGAAVGGRIELPYLQLALVKIWQAEGGEDATGLHSWTLTHELHGVAEIARRHLDEVMRRFDAPAQAACARMFDRLVTPSGGKIAYRRSDLERFSRSARVGAALASPRMQQVANLLLPPSGRFADPLRVSLGIERTPTELEVARILDLLADQDVGQPRSEPEARRILRSVPSVDDTGEPSYEIFHDVLARPVLAWKDRFNAKRERLRMRARTIALASVGGTFFLLALVASGFALVATQARTAADAARSEALAQAQRAEAQAVQALASASQAQRVGGVPAVATLLALDAVGRAKDRPAKDRAEALRALRSAIYVDHERLYLEGHGGVPTIAYSRDGRLLATGSDGGAVTLFDAISGDLIRRVEQGELVHSVSFSPDGRWLATGLLSGRVRLWRVPDLIEELNWVGHGSSVRAVRFTADGEHLVTGSQDGTARLWSLDQGRLIQTFQHGNDQERVAVRGVALSPDGHYIATGADDGFHLWDRSDGSELVHIDDRIARYGHKGSVRDLDFRFDGSELLTGSWDGTAAVWGLSELLRDRTDAKPRLVLRQHNGFVRSVAFNPAGDRIATGSSDGTVRIWGADGNRERLLLTLRGHMGDVWSVAFSPDGRRIASASADQTARVWDVERSDAVVVFASHRGRVWSVAFSPDGKELAMSAGSHLLLWNLETGDLVGDFALHERSIRDVAFNHDGRRIATVSTDGKIVVYRRDTGESTKATRFHKDTIRSVVFSPDDKWIATASDDATAKLWNLETSQEVRSLKGHEERVWSVAFSPDGLRIATGSEDDTVRLWNAATGDVVRVLRGHVADVRAVAFSPDGRRLATGSIDSRIILWDVASGEEVSEFRGHRGTVGSIAFSPDGQQLASASDDLTVRLWEVSSGDMLAVLEGHSKPVFSVAFSPDGRWIASASDDGTARVWQVFPNEDELVAFASSRLSRHRFHESEQREFSLEERP